MFMFIVCQRTNFPAIYVYDLHYPLGVNQVVTFHMQTNLKRILFVVFFSLLFACDIKV